MSELNKVYIHSAAALGPLGDRDASQRQVLTRDPPKLALNPLTKEVCGHALRQASHLVQLAVIAATLCCQRLPDSPAEQLPVYVGTGLGELSKTTSLFEQVMPPANGMASPFDFINASSNMAAFYVAKSLNSSARNLTLSQDEFSFEWALQLALLDLQLGNAEQALVGGMDEHVNDRSAQLRRIHLNPQQIIGEGSGWLMLSTQAQQALGELLWVDVLPTHSEMAPALWAQHVLAAISACIGTTANVCLLPGFRISEPETETLLEQLPSATRYDYLKYCGCFHSAAAFGLASLFDTAHGDTQHYVHLNKNSQGQTMMVVVHATG